MSKIIVKQHPILFPESLKLTNLQVIAIEELVDL
jgi:hypothetical protein